MDGVRIAVFSATTIGTGLAIFAYRTAHTRMGDGPMSSNKTSTGSGLYQAPVKDRTASMPVMHGFSAGGSQVRTVSDLRPAPTKQYVEVINLND